MKRTQLYFDDTLFRLLAEISRAEKTTISDLVRKAVQRVYAKGKRKKNLLKTLGSTFGMWKDREDLASTEDYIRGLRKDTRSKRWNPA